MKIFKYALALGYQVLFLPAGARLLTVQLQHGEPQLWALIDPAQPEEPRRILIMGTGQYAPDGAEYISTYQMQDGDFVFHAFEVRN